MKPEELRKKTTKELQNILRQKREDLRRHRFNLVSGKIKDVKKIKKTKKDIARILTILNKQPTADKEQNPSK